MRIEVLIGNEDPLVFPLNHPKISLGTSENCDIIINADGVSRKHVIIISEDENYFVVDQGSTNGTYINEERLIPGRRVEFTSFFPVRLGDDVLISLLSEEESHEMIEIPFPSVPPVEEKPKIQRPVETNHEKTTVISLKDLKIANTEKLVTVRDKKRAVRKKEVLKKKPKKEFNIVPWLSLIILGAAAYYNFYIVEKDQQASPIKVADEPGVKLKTPGWNSKESNKEMDLSKKLIPESDITEKSQFKNYLNGSKCTTEIEKYLCQFFPGAMDPNYGVLQVGLNFYVLIDGAKVFHEARRYVKTQKDLSPENKLKQLELLQDIGIYIYLLKIKEKLDLEKLKDFNLYIGFFGPGENGIEAKRVLAIKPSEFNGKDSYVSQSFLSFIRANGQTGLLQTKTHYRTY